MARIARLVIRHRLLVVGVWIVLTFVGAFSAAKLSNRWFQSFSIPGFSAYEANQRTLKTFGSGEQPPLVPVFTAPGRDITKVPGLQHAIERTSEAVPGSRTGDWFDTHSDMYLSKDRHTMVATIYPPGNATFSSFPPIDQARAALRQATPAGVQSHLTGRDAIFASQGGTSGPGVLDRDADRRRRRAHHPALRLRDAARGRDAARDGGGLDPDHVRRASTRSRT